MKCVSGQPPELTVHAPDAPVCKLQSQFAVPGEDTKPPERVHTTHKAESQPTAEVIRQWIHQQQYKQY